MLMEMENKKFRLVTSKFKVFSSRKCANAFPPENMKNIVIVFYRFYTVFILYNGLEFDLII